MSPPDTLTVGPSLLKIVGGVTLATLAICVVLVALVFVLEYLANAGLLGLLPVPLWVWSHRWAIVGWTSLALASYRGIAVLGALLWSRPRIEIDSNGFTDYGVVGKRSRRWTDIEGRFSLIRIGFPFAVGWQQVVAYRVTNECKTAAMIKPLDFLAGNDEAILICGELTLSAVELADVLNRCKQDAASVAGS
jgi:hypothetical protein